MDIVGTTRALLARAGTEARFAGTLLHARGAGAITVPPHRYLGVLRALTSYGPAGAAISLAAAGQGGNTAIVDDRGAVSFAELDHRSSALANALIERGFTAGDSIGLLVRNHRGMYDVLFAGAKLGAKTLLLNTDFAAPQLRDVCEREDVTVLIHDEEFESIAHGVDTRLGRMLAWHDDAPGEGVTTLEGAITATHGRTPPRPSRMQKIILLTSGTTGTPKGAPRDMELSLAIPGGYLSKIPLRSGRRVLLAAPAFHAWGLLSSTVALGLGNTLYLTRKFDPKAALDTLEQNRCDALITVPILLSRMLEAAGDDLGGRDLSALRVVAVSGSALSAELAERAMDAFGDILYNLYGSTEVAYATIATPADMRAAPGTVGRPPHGTTIKIIDEDGRPVRTGDTGRIFVGSSIQFEGYTGGGSKEVVDGLMSTGDVGHLDAAGRLFVEGRDDDMIVSGGENVFPREVEDLLASHESIDEAAVLGVDDEKFGKRLRAYVVRTPGAADIDEDGVRDFVKDNLARYKVPRDVIFLDELPRNPAGKVVKRQLPDPDADDS